MQPNPIPTVSMIIPVHNGGQGFQHCLESISAAYPPPEEIIVVADGESDGSYRLAERFGARMMKLDAPGGPAKARNKGAGMARQDILFFVDADVTIPENAIAVIKKTFMENPGLSALIGSYDDTPAAANFLSQYKNLFHHYVHQTANPNASTFWTGCGAIRREVFLAMGGFDETYRKPAIEDIELGYRLTGSGNTILLVKALQVTHLKKWTGFSLLWADIFYRAIPWTRLILRDRRLPNDLNLKTGGRLSTILVLLMLISISGALLFPPAAGIAVPPAVGLLWINRDVYRFFMDRRGPGFTLKAIFWHWLYFLYSGIGFIMGAFAYLLKDAGQ